MRILVLILVVIGAFGCTKHLAPPKTAQPVSSDHAAALAAWSRVLQAHVNDKGQIDFEAIKKAPDDLHAYVTWAATHGPKSNPQEFATREQKLAYYLNTYNALCMYNAITNTRRPKQIVRFFLWTKLQMDGEEISLYALENSIVRPQFKDPRVHFILNCMVRGCPRLPREPMQPDLLEDQLQLAAKLFFSEEPRNVQVVESAKTIRLSSILKFYTEDFLAPNTDSTNLIQYANKFRESKLNEEYEVEFIDYDWTLNQSPRVAPAEPARSPSAASK